jgi:hypothetical protein
MKHLIKYNLFESNSDIISNCELILIDLEDFGLRVDINQYNSTKELNIFITNNYEENSENQTQREFLFPKIKEFDYNNIKHNIEELISFLSDSYHLESIYNISNYSPRLINLEDLENLEYIQRIEFRFRKK